MFKAIRKWKLFTKYSIYDEFTNHFMNCYSIKYKPQTYIVSSGGRCIQMIYLS